MDNKASDIGGIIGIFFMALTLAIVSFSCTGPILGSLLGGSLTSDGGAMQLSFGMGGFGLALALPFALFALFAGGVAHRFLRRADQRHRLGLAFAVLGVGLTVGDDSGAGLIAVFPVPEHDCANRDGLVH